jgi:hypothetical protein
MIWYNKKMRGKEILTATETVTGSLYDKTNSANMSQIPLHQALADSEADQS